MAEMGDGSGRSRPRARSRAPSPGPQPRAGPDAIRLTRGTRVPVRRQLAVQLAAGLRAGWWEDGDRLPSARRLARRLGLDRKTVDAAYRELSDRGHVEVRPGGGTYPVACRGPGSGTGRDGRSLRGFLARERTSGRSARELEALLARWRGAVEARRVVVAGRDPDLLAVWTAEAREAFEPAGLSVEPVGVERPGAGSRPLAAAALVLAGPACRAAAEARAPAWTEVVGLRPGVPPGARRLLARMPPGAVVAAVSRSRRLLAELEALAAGLRGGQVAVAGVSPDDGTRLRRRLRVARFVLVDLPARAALAGRIPADRRRTLRHLAPGELEAAARWLGR